MGFLPHPEQPKDLPLSARSLETTSYSPEMSHSVLYALDKRHQIKQGGIVLKAEKQSIQLCSSLTLSSALFSIIHSINIY